MKTHNKILGFFMIFTLLLTVSCDDILVNEDPNGVVLDELLPDVIMPGAQSRPASTLMTSMNELGNTMIATWSGNAQQIQAPYFVEFQYQLSTDFYDQIWDQLYIRTSNLSVITNYNGEGNYDYYKGAARILRAFYFQYLVDLYGDIPYSESHLRGDLLFPKYDNQEDIYRNLVDEVNQGISLIDNTNTVSVINMGTNDIMLGGDMNMWKKFGNSLKLRLLVRLTEKASLDTDTQTFIQNEFNSLNTSTAEFLGLGDDVTINPGYSDEQGRMNPFSETFGYDPGEFGNVASETFSNRRAGPTTFLVEFLNGTTTGQMDSRLERLYATRPGQGAIQGNTQGGGNQPSRIGPGLLSSPTQDGYIMTAAESLFLQAEARQRGYLTIGSGAKALFQDGIRASFNKLGATGAEAYITASDNTNLIGWEGTTNKIEAIVTQKWIALGGTNGVETWIEFNRTGFPSNMPLPEITSQTTRPKRLLYPTSEYTGNSANVSSFNQTVSSAFTTNIFWDVN